ncbi:MAG: DNA polymerase III subunit delta, partial [Sutterella sp.]
MATTDPRCFCEQCKKSGALPAFVLVTGNDDFLMIEASDEIRQCARDLGYLDREVFEMNGNSDWSQVTMSAADVGMFADQKVVDVRIPGGKIGRKGPDGLQKLLSQPYDGVCVLFTVPTPDWATAKAAWWQNLQKSTEVITCNTPPRQALGRWLAERLQRQGQSASPEALEYLADQVEGNL